MAIALTLFCLPCAGASATMYLRWRRSLPSWISVQPIELPGRGSRLHELPQKNYDELTIRLCDELVAMRPERYAFFGHSMGALLAYGITQHISTRNLPLPAALLISGCAAPNRQDSERYNNIKGRAALIADLRKQGGTPEAVFDNPELLTMTLDLLSVDYRVCGSFQHAQLPFLPIPIHVFGGRADTIKASELDDWRLTGNRAFTLDWFEGGHFFLRQSEEAFLSMLTRRLTESLNGVAREACATA